jgi:hypothetical protein
MLNFLPESEFYYRYLPRVNFHHILLDDKIIAHGIKRQFNVPVPTLVAFRRDGRWFGEGGETLDLEEFRNTLNKHIGTGLVVKPAVLTSGGEGIRMIQESNGGEWMDGEGVKVPVETLYQCYPHWDLLIQVRLVNGGSMIPFGRDILECFRVLTAFKAGRPEALYVVLKIASQGSYTDNGRTGGIYVAVEPSSGTLSRVGVDQEGTVYEECPRTGTRFGNVRIQEVREIISCVERAALAFSSLSIVGWDIGLTEAGPVVIEGNSSPSLAMIQKTHHGSRRLIQCLRESNRIPKNRTFRAGDPDGTR